MVKEKIQGKRILLSRPPSSMETAETVFAVIDKSREAFAPWLDWVQTTTKPEDTLQFLENANKDWNNGTHFLYAIYLEGQFIGLISAFNVAKEHKRAEIGYWLDTDYTGKGYMTEAIKLLEEELFNNDFNRIVICTDVLNTKSAKLPQSLNYTLEGVLRQDLYSEPLARFRDMNIFAKLREHQKSL